MKEKIAEEKKLSYEEFQLFYESTEKVTDRRLGANRWNYSICTAILVANAGLLNWGISKPTFLVISVVGVLILSGMATLFCSLWIGQIKKGKWGQVYERKMGSSLLLTHDPWKIKC